MVIRFFLAFSLSQKKNHRLGGNFFFSPPSEHHPPTDTTTTGGGVRCKCGGRHRAQRVVDGGGGDFRPYFRRIRHPFFDFF